MYILNEYVKAAYNIAKKGKRYKTSKSQEVISKLIKMYFGL